MDVSDPIILVIGVPELAAENFLSGVQIREVTCWDEVGLYLQEKRVAVIVFGPSVDSKRIHHLLNQSSKAPLESKHIVLYDATASSAYQDLIDNDLIYYLSHASIPLAQLRKTVGAALQVYSQKRRPSATLHNGLWTDSEDDLRSLLSRMAAHTDPRELSLAITASLSDYLHVRHARCLFYNPDLDCLGITFDENETAISAASGILGYVARTRERVRITSVPNDPRYDPHADNPESIRAAHLIAAPLDINDRTIAVITALRPAQFGPFTSDDESRLLHFAQQITPLLNALLPRAYAGEYASDREIFRTEALEYHELSDTNGSIIRKIPMWIAQSHLVLVILFFVGIGYLLRAKVRQQAASPAVVRLAGKLVPVPAPTSGKLTSFFVEPGSLVHSGDVLGVLQSNDTASESRRTYLRAPIDGVITDVSIHPGQIATVGSSVVNIEQNSDTQLVIFLPGYYAPTVQVGTSIVFIPDGYPQSREPTTISAIEPNVIGPNAANSLVDKDVVQTLQLTGSLLVARATLSSTWFNAGSQRLRYHNGMTGQVEFNVAPEPLIVAMAPKLKNLYQKHQSSRWSLTQSRAP